MSTCALADCEKPKRQRGQYCRMHAARVERHGDPNVVLVNRLTDTWSRIAPEGASTLRRLLAGIESDDDCWLWGRGRADTGYGQIHVDGRKRGTHVVMWEQIHGTAVPDGMFVCHSCDVRHCINPAHLWIGTHADNMRDMAEKGRNRVYDGCSVAGCERPHSSHGFCKKHYARWAGTRFPEDRAALERGEEPPERRGTWKRGAA